jgi:16S rRNA (guanine527-N7)-methyltransferase
MEILEKYFADFSKEQLNQLSALKELYEDWNQKINVISRKDLDNFYLHHVLHSLSIAATFQFEDGFEVLDLGCGGGFPGIPLAVFFPQVRFHLVDSINKKLNVVNEISAAIGLSNLTTQHTRVEDIKNRKFDNVVSRAVAPLGDLWRWSRPLLRKVKADSENTPNGLICLKGGDLAQEIHTSGCKPFVWEIDQIFNEDYFKEKFVLYQRIK